MDMTCHKQTNQSLYMNYLTNLLKNRGSIIHFLITAKLFV